MAKKQILNYVFEPGISKDANLYPRAVALLSANKAYLQAMVVAYINYNITNNVAPYVSYTYAPTKCTRDVGFFIDAILHDLRYGGNVKTRATADYFWIDGKPMIRGDVSPEITGQAYLRTLINDFIFTNTPVTQNYGQTAVQQVFIAGQNAEAGASTRNTALWAIFSDVITNGTDELPVKSTGVSAIKLLGKYEASEILLITDVNNGNILYNFADNSSTISFDYKQGRSSGDGQLLSDLDFPSWWQTTDTITTIYLSENTSSLTVDSDIQIFVEEPYQTIRPWDFGTDAIERMRVAAPQAMLDADFEYGLQPTKWQAIGMLRSYPSFYEQPGTDLSVSAMITDASSGSGGFGSSLITVTVTGAHGYSPGTVITVKGLDNSVSGFSRGEGTFLVATVPNSLTFTYYSSAKVGTSNGQSVFTSFVQIRQAGFYTGASLGQPSFSVFSNGSSLSITSKFLTLSNSYQIAFDGTSPTVGAPISGSPNIPAGTSISSVVGAGTVTANFEEDVLATDTQVKFTDYTGVQQGMALDNGSGTAIFINSINNDIASLSGAIGQNFNGSNGETLGVSGTNIQGIGTGALFNVSRSTGSYTVVDAEDSSSNGTNYVVGDYIKIVGTDLGGASPANDLLIKVTSVDSGGAITGVSWTGNAISGGATYTSILQTSTTGPGNNARITVIRAGGTGLYSITLASGGGSHAPGDVVTWAGTNFGGTSPANDITIQVDGVSFPAAAIVDFTILGGTGVSGNASYTQPSSANLTLSGSGAVFNVTRFNGNYEVEVDDAAGAGGTGYFQDSKIRILGNALGGTTPANDCILSLTAVSGGIISSVTATGTPFAGDTTNIYPALSISEATTGTISDGTVLNAGAIATIQVDFTSNHGLVPGASILTNITSTPAPAFASSSRTLPSSGTWSSVDFADGKFVAVRNGSNLTGRSIDGTNWSAGGVMPSSAQWTATAAGIVGSTYYHVAVSSGGTAAAYSSDGGLTWSASTLPSSGSWTSVAYNEGYFAAVRSGSTAAAYSSDGGLTWSASTLPSSSNWSDVAGGIIGSSSYFVAIATGSTAAAYSVDNGANWTASTLPSSTTWSSIEFGNSRFFAVARATAAGAVSTNGTSWSSVTLPSSANWNEIAFGDDNFVVVADGGTQCLTTFTGETGSFTENTLAANSTWEGIAYGNYSGVGIFAVVGLNTAALSIVLTSANHQLGAGPFVVTQVPSFTSLRYPARSTGTISTDTTIRGNIYARPDTFFTHRPFDGGVQLGTGGPQHASQAIRQSKKYVRYQSGKGIMYTTGALFAPNMNLASAVAVDYPANSLITFTTDDTDHGLQSGAVIEITGCSSFEYNGEYIVENITSSRSFRCRALVPLSTLTADLSADAKVSIKNWHGSTVKVGAFDDQNGIFYQYDGYKLAVVRRSSTQQLTGTVACSLDSNVVTGSGTRFTQQLIEGDKIVIRGMSHTVTKITSDTSMTVNPDWRGVNSVTGAKVALTTDLVIPQEEWNMDRLDGTGPSGFNWVPNKMQMIGIQYSWYAAGFIEWMLRGSDGKFVFLHRLRNSNVNTEAYMRTANLPVRYEVENTSAKSELRVTINSSVSSIELVDGYYFPTSGIIYIDNELIAYSGKDGNTLSGLTRGATMTAFSAGQNRGFTAGAAASHSAGAGVILVSCTATPTISHWGSALLTDGLFDEDRGYIFNYAATGLSISTTKQTAFMIRLAPSVSNALVGDLGERDLLNRAQLLLNQVAIAADTGSGIIVVEGVLNPRNYPTNPSNIIWSGLSSSAAGGQPSFAQIAVGGGINWGGVPLTTSTAAVSGAVQSTVTAVGVTSGTQFRNAFSIARNSFIITNLQYDTSGLQIGDTLINGTYLIGNRSITNIQRSGFSLSGTFYTVITMNNNATTTSPLNTNISTTTQITGTAASYTNSNFLFFTNASWNSSGAQVGTRLDSSVTQFPAGTAVTGVVSRTLGATVVRRVTFTQSSNTSIAAAANITFQFGDVQFALPGEQVFSFVCAPGGQDSLDLGELKELTTTAIGGRGTFPNGPDVLAINVYKVSGTALTGSVILRWGEAQA